MIFGQDDHIGCGHNPSPETIKKFGFDAELRSNYALRSQTITWIPIQIHIAFTNTGGGGISDYTVNNTIAEVNADFLPSGVQFYECGPRNYIYNTAISQFNYNVSDATLTNTYDVPNVLNLYYVNSITLNGQGLCGYAYFPGGPDHLVVDDFCSISGKTLTHEFGHAFTLYHTHGKSNTQLTDELVDGSNCSVAGDDVCDTPAEPNLWGQVNGNCDYTGNQVDNNGAPFDPPTNNIMSYAPGGCRNAFTPQQYNRIAYSAQNDRPYLQCNTPAPCVTPITSLPYSESFENGLGGWSQDLTENFDFTLQSGPTPTANTGPTTAQDGSNYLYTEGSAPNLPNMIAVVNSPCFDFSNINSAEFRFWYHMYGANTGQLVMQASTDGGYYWGAPNFLFDLTGDQGNQWQEAVIDLSPWAGEQFLRFRIGVVLGGEASDIAIDNIRILETTNPCIGFSASMTSTNISCNGMTDGSSTASVIGGTPPHSYLWSNNATTSSIQNLTAGSYTLTVTDANQCTATGTVQITEPFPVGVELSTTNTSAPDQFDASVTFANISGGTLPFSFQWSNGAISQSINNVTNGNYSLTVTDANGCTAENQIFVSAPLACNGTKSNWPYTNQVENGLGIFKQNKFDDDKNWKKRSGSTPTAGTGPASAYAGTYYRHVESSGSSNQDKTSVITTKKCLDFTVLNQPTFTFWYHMNGNTMGSLDVQVSYDGGTTWRGSVWTREGNQGSNWQKAVVDLSTYPSIQKRVRIVGTTGNGDQSDIAIDLIKFVEAVNADLQDIFTMDDDDQLHIEQYDITNVFPNPARDIVNIDIETPLEGMAQLRLISTTGQSVVAQETELLFGDNRIQIETHDVASGLYYLQVKFAGKAQSKLVMIQK